MKVVGFCLKETSLVNYAAFDCNFIPYYCQKCLQKQKMTAGSSKIGIVILRNINKKEAYVTRTILSCLPQS